MVRLSVLRRGKNLNLHPHEYVLPQSLQILISYSYATMAIPITYCRRVMSPMNSDALERRRFQPDEIRAIGSFYGTLPVAKVVFPQKEEFCI